MSIERRPRRGRVYRHTIPPIGLAGGGVLKRGRIVVGYHADQVALGGFVDDDFVDDAAQQCPDFFVWGVGELGG